MIKFQKIVSKGSRFNQIYIPKDMAQLIEVGDEVEVKLLKKHIRLYYSKGLKLSLFKENLIKSIFDEIGNVGCLYIVGSFLIEKVDYNDIDIVIVNSIKINEQKIYNKLAEKFDLKFHIIFIKQNKFSDLLKICPLTRTMFSKFVCNKKFVVPDEKRIDANHIRFLLMMPYDLLEIRLNSKSFFDSIRRLIAIERFLEDKGLDIFEINEKMKNELKTRLYEKIRYNEEIEENSINLLREIMKLKLKKIEELIDNG